MATNESKAPASAVLLHNLTNLAIIAAVGFVLWMAWPLIMERMAGGVAPVAQPLPAAATTRPQAVQPAPVIIQRVQESEPAPAPPVVNIPPQPQPQPAAIDNAAPITEPAPAPAPAPVVIVHRQTDNGRQTITGSGACAVGGSVARRCGK